ncbi:DUF559 domain-containing protein [bacterium]|nr:DUF559 domain-containing protein [bacterium]
MPNKGRVGARSSRVSPSSGLKNLVGVRQEAAEGINKFKETTQPRAAKATNIENQLRYAMLRKNIDFVEQADIGPWSIDFLLPEYRIVVEADGEYWHSDVKTKMKDRRKDAWLKAKGFEVLHFEGKQIEHNPDFCIEKIIELIEKQKSQHSGGELPFPKYIEDTEEEDLNEQSETEEESEYEKWIRGTTSFGRGRTS